MHSKTFLPLLLLVQFLCQTSGKFHQSLSLREVRSLFHVDSHDEVPDYEVVHINHHRSRRSTESQSEVRVIKLTAFDSDHSLTLKPNKVLAKDVPVFYAEHDPHRDKVVVKPVLEKLNSSVGIPYQDEESMAAITISTDPETGRDVMDGTIGEDLIIKPLPTSVADLLRKNEDLDSLTWRREEEHNINAIRPPDDQVFLDEGEAILSGDLEFSDQFPLVADDDTKTGQHQLVRKPFSESEPERNKTLPAGLELLRRRRRAVLDSRDMHVVFKRSAKERGAPFDTTFMEEDIINQIKQNRVKRSSGSAPSVIYPEILVLVDYDGYLLHDKDNTKIKSYYVSFWNGADLRYKLLSHPRIKLSIAGIIISRSRDAMPYLERNRVGRDAIDSASALTDMGKYLFQERRLPTYDIAVAITKLDMCRRTYKGSPCNRGTAGFAYVGGACVVNKRLKKVNSVAIVEDTGGFSGIIVAAHEVGHLLGAVHDGSPPPNYLGGPGAQRCKWEDGYIMSDLRHTEKGFKWSDCSVKQFQHFLNGDTATCLYNLPHEDESLPRILPGKLLTLDQQCRKDRGTSACFKDDRVCAQLFCFDAQSGYCVSYRPAAEGSECGGGKVCKNGRCVYDNENSISDHDHGSTIWSDGRTTWTTSSISSISHRTSVSTRTLDNINNYESTYVSDGDCNDKVSNITGTLSCKQFLQSYGARYCDHRYIMENCCKSRREICENRL